VEGDSPKMKINKNKIRDNMANRKPLLRCHPGEFELAILDKLKLEIEKLKKKQY